MKKSFKEIQENINKQLEEMNNPSQTARKSNKQLIETNKAVQDKTRNINENTN